MTEPSAPDGLKARVSGVLEQASARVAQGAVEKKLADAADALLLSPQQRAEKADADARAARAFKIKLGLGAVAVVGLGIGVMGVLAKLWMWAIGLLVLAGVGTAGYLVVWPKVQALKERTTARLTAARTERAQADAAAQKQAQLDRALAELKKKAQP